MRKQIAALTILALPATASAGVLGFSFGAGYDYWTAEPSGGMDDADTGAGLNMEDDLNMDDSEEGQLWAYFEHPVPLIPNVRLQQSNLDVAGDDGDFDYTLQTPFGDFDAAIEDIDSRLDLDMDDFIVYWSPLPENILTLGVLSLDIGLNIRNVSGDLYMEGEDTTVGDTHTVDEDISATVPMGYGSLRANIPGTGVSLGGAISTLSFGDNEFTDTTLDVAWRSSMGLGVRGGVRTIDLVLEDAGDVDLDMEFSGAFLGAFYQF